MTGVDFVMVFVTVLGVVIWIWAGYEWWKNKKARRQLKEGKGN